jgi:hypothetical protein
MKMNIAKPILTAAIIGTVALSGAGCGKTTTPAPEKPRPGTTQKMNRTVKKDVKKSKNTVKKDVKQGGRTVKKGLGAKK